MSNVNIRINGADALSGTREDGSIKVPLRNIFEALGFHVGWEDSTQTIRTTGFGYESTFKIGQEYFDLEDSINPANSKKGVPLSSVPYISNGKTIMPLVAPLQSAGYSIVGKGGTVEIKTVAPREGMNAFVVVASDIFVSNYPGGGPSGLPRLQMGMTVFAFPFTVVQKGSITWIQVTYNSGKNVGWVNRGFLRESGAENLTFDICIKSMEDYLQTGLLSDDVISWMAKNGTAKPVRNFVSGAFQGHKNDTKFNDEILAWTNFWNYRIQKYIVNPYPNKTLIRADVVKAIIAQESSMGIPPTPVRKNGTRNVMGCLFAGDPTLWIASAINPLITGKYHINSAGKNAITVRKLDGTIEPDGSLISSYDASETNKYRFGTGFKILDTVILTRGGGSSGNEYLIEYNAMTPKMSIAIGIGTLAWKINGVGNGIEETGVKLYGTGDTAYVNFINGYLVDLGAAALQK